jgi:hypothetical protein
MNVLICVCSNSPNPLLYENIDKLYKIQINTPHTQKYKYKVHIVDSDSDDLTNYIKVYQNFPDIEIHMIKNKNYEYGAWKYILNKYPFFDIYFCIQDSTIINKFIDLNVVDDKNAYTFHHNSGYNAHLSIKDLGIEMLKTANLNYMSIIDTDFNIAQMCTFIVNKKTLEDIFKHFTIPPINRDGSCVYERNFGIYFLDKGINTFNLYNFMNKTYLRRV